MARPKVNPGFAAAMARWDKMDKQYRARIERQRRGLTRMIELNSKLVAGLIEIKEGVKNPAGRADMILTESEELMRGLQADDPEADADE